MKTTYKNVLIDSKETDLTVEDGKIVSVGKTESGGEDKKGLKAYPGLIDVHSHGMMGYDTMDGKYLLQMSSVMAEHGVTAWCPTTMTMNSARLKEVTDGLPKQNSGATILGFHLEGPYINAKYKGAQNGNYIATPNLAEFEQYNNIALVTIAPELEGSMEFIRRCKSVVCIGHTGCDYATAVQAIENGATCLTHTFNAMPGIHHRSPGPIPAAIDKNCYVQVICDGLHIQAPIIRMLYKLFGAERMVLISDSMRATGLSDGEYEFGGQKITVLNGVARTKDGAIAGSTTFLYDCVQKAIEFGIPEADAYKMASQTPAELLGIKKGKIEAGYDADLIFVNEKNKLVQVVKAN